MEAHSNAQASAPTPLPKAQLIALGMMNFVDTAGAMMLLPYAVDFVSHVSHIEKDSPEVGHRVGLLVGIYSITEMLLCYLWGRLADKWGRKPVLLVGMAGSALAALGFGFSNSYSWALAMRALDGAFCGNMGVTKTYLGEVTDKTNQARGFSLIALAYSVGMLVGPAFGGYLSEPADRLPALFGDVQVLQDYPFLLPNVCLALCGLFGMTLGFFVLQEPRRDVSESEETCSARALETLLPEESQNVMGQLLKAQTPFLRTSFMYGCWSGYFALYSQTFVLLTQLPQNIKGFELTTADLGLLQNLAAVSLLLSQKWGYPVLQPKAGLFKCWTDGWLAILGSRLLYIPLSFLCFAGAALPKGACMVFLALLHMGGAFAAGFPCPTISVWVNRSIPSNVRGAGFGLSSAVGAACRGAFPLVGGALFSMGRSWEEAGGTTWGRYLPILFGCMVCVCAIAASSRLPVSYQN